MNLKNLTPRVALAALVGRVRIALLGALALLGVTVGGSRFLSPQAGAVVALKSTAITNRDATPLVLNPCNIEKGVLRESQGFASIANGDSIGSTYRICSIRSSDRVSQILLYSPDIGTTAITDIGLYDTTAAGGAVVDADFFASAVNISSGALNGVDVTFEAGVAGGLITNAEKRIWEMLGLSADPGKDYDVTFTLTAASDAAGVALLRVAFVSGN